MRLILLRHGETLWNAEHRLQGHDNSPLSERGVEQARRFALFAGMLRPSRVVSSDLGRARHTAALVGFPDCPSDPRLRERDLGAWTGRARPDLLREDTERYRAWRAGTYLPDGAESWEQFRARIADGLRHWLNIGEGDLLVIAHNGVIRAACDEFLGLPRSRLVPTSPGAAAILAFADGGAGAAQLEAYNIGALSPDRSVAE